MQNNELLKKLIETRAELNSKVDERKGLSEDIKACKEVEDKILRQLEEALKNE